MTALFILSKNRGDVYAVPYRNRRAQTPIVLRNETHAQSPTIEQDRHLPERLYAKLGLDVAGEPVTLGASENTVVRFVRFTGVFALPDGTVAAVYGGKADEVQVCSVVIQEREPQRQMVHAVVVSSPSRTTTVE